MQTDLPQLPVPPLADTLARYEEFVTPLLDANELHNTRQMIADFAAVEGPALQREVEALAAEAHARNTSYVAGYWWSMYTEYRAPQPVRVVRTDSRVMSTHSISSHPHQTHMHR